MRLMFDASSPPETIPTGYSAAAGYIGGDTPHVWTKDEWARFRHNRKLPIFVRSNPTAENAAGAEADAISALESVYYLGIPRGTAIALDFETATDQAYYDTFSNVLSYFDFHTWLYGSASTVFKVQATNYWVADWTGTPFRYNHAGVRATQYKNGSAYDSSTVNAWEFHFRLATTWTKI